MGQRYFGVDAGMQSSPQITKRDRIEIGVVYNVYALSAGAHTTTLYVMVDIVRGDGRAGATPHPLQPGQIFPS
jgi:hypothetical protein